MMELLIKGIAFGFAVAAPVGPIGLLCIKRTLDHGRAAGLASGFGAATADAVYGMIVATGLAITGLLVSYAVPLKIGGGFLLACLGLISLYSFGSKSKGNTSAPDASPAKHVLSAFSTTFVLTLSNPMTILTFIALISGIGASASALPGTAYRLVLGVFIGSALWWLLLVQGTLFARSKIKLSVLRYVDLLSGLILLVWSMWITADALKIIG
jgi:threonine/homoserine/homoserine lactone efflux protein